MQLFNLKTERGFRIVLLDDRMRIVKPVLEFLDYLRIRDHSWNTCSSMGSDLKEYWKFLESNGYNYLEMSPRKIGDFLEWLREPVHDRQVNFIRREPVRTGRTINRMLSTVRSFYKYHLNMSEIDNPVLMETAQRPPDMFRSLLYHTRQNNRVQKSVWKVKQTEQKIRTITEDQAELLKSKLHCERDRLIFRLAHEAGMRVGEILSLQIGDIPNPNPDEVLGVITVIERKENRKDQQIKPDVRNVYTPMNLLTDLNLYIQDERLKIRDAPHDYLFVTDKEPHSGRPMTYMGVHKQFMRIGRETGIDISIHDLRHTFATDLIAMGLDISVVSKLLGHKHISSTMIYVHIVETNNITKKLVPIWNRKQILSIK